MSKCNCYIDNVILSYRFESCQDYKKIKIDMTIMTIGLIIFTIVNIITSMFATVIYKQEYTKANKYVVFSLFFVGYFLFFYIVSQK